MTASEATTVFDDETTLSASAEPKTVTPPEANQDAPTFTALVGNGKKFKTTEDLAKSKVEADAFIQKIQDENKELRKELEARMSSEEAIKALTAAKGNQPPSEVSPEHLRDMVKETVSELDRDKAAKQNILAANAYLIDKLGGKAEAEAFLNKKSVELGIPIGWLKDMAARSPKALYNTLGVDAPSAVVPTSTKGDINTLAKNNAPDEQTKGTKAYYEAIRKSNPSAYWSTKVQNEIFEASKKGTYK
jgi:hypothetical protein